VSIKPEIDSNLTLFGVAGLHQDRVYPNLTLRLSVLYNPNSLVTPRGVLRTLVACHLGSRIDRVFERISRLGYSLMAKRCTVLLETHSRLQRVKRGRQAG
jgi:hypothetical protein